MVIIVLAMSRGEVFSYRVVRKRAACRCTRPGCAMTLDPFAKGMILGLADGGASTKRIASKVRKTDGEHPSQRAVQQTIAGEEGLRKRSGERRPGSGRPPSLTHEEKEKVVALVFAERGSAVVTAKYCRRKLPFLKRVSRWVITRALQDAGLRWLRRRQKRLVKKEHRAQRLQYARWVLKQSEKLLRSFAYVDGTTYYLARCETEAVDQERRRLGPYVWKMASGKDGLFSDTVGPSLYSKAQGAPVKVWGMLAKGRLCYHVLPEAGKGKTVHMNGARYRKMLNRSADQWLKSCFGKVPKQVNLIQDYERCLWQRASLRTLLKHHLFAMDRFPKSSPDLNAIEQVWNLLRQMLDETAPVEVETRQAFLARFRRTVYSLNSKHSAALLAMCSNQKDRAREVLRLKGARTRW